MPRPNEIHSTPLRTACLRLAVCMAALTSLTACGTTRRTDTTRTASEQLLISNAIDQAVAQLDFGPIAGKTIYFDGQYLASAVDEKYLTSTLRQHLLHFGCILVTDKAKAQYVVEARSGAIGTDRHDITVGIPAVNLPTAVAATGVPPVIPEIPFAKSTDQKGVAKIAVFAYEQETGKRVWQSGVAMVTSDAKDTWILGVGPFQRGSIYDGTNFVGAEVLTPFGTANEKKHHGESGPNRQTLANVTNETIFLPPPLPAPSASPQPTPPPPGAVAAAPQPAVAQQGVVQASHQAPVAAPPNAPPAATPSGSPTASAPPIGSSSPPPAHP